MNGDWGWDGEEGQEEEMTLAAPTCMQLRPLLGTSSCELSVVQQLLVLLCSTTFPVPGAEPTQAGE